MVKFGVIKTDVIFVTDWFYVWYVHGSENSKTNLFEIDILLLHNKKSILMEIFH